MNMQGPTMDTTQQVSLDELLAVIYDATAQQDHRRVESSAKRLKQLFQQPGVYDALHTIAADKALPLSVRIQASIQFKNEALKNWKSRKLQNDQYRANIRARCMMFLDEEDATIADCNKVSVAKIARADFPQAWPSLLDYLMSVIDDTLKQRYGPAGVDDPQSNLKLQRALQLLCAITKEFSSMKMLNGIQVMKQIFDHLHHTINNYFVEVFECIQLPPSPQTLENPRLYTDLVVSHLLFKTLVTLLIWIWQRASRMTNEEKQMSSPWISAVFSTSVQQLQRLVVQRAEVIKAQEHTTPLSAQALSTHQVMTKHIRRFGKFFLRMAEVDPRRMAELPQCSDIVIFYWDQIVAAADNLQGIQDNPAAPFPVRFLVQGLVLFKDVVGQWTAHRRDGTQNKIVLQEDFIKKAVTIIITRLLPFTQQDLQGLGDDPEEWVNNEDQENQQWEYELRPCSERVLMQISNQYPEYVTPLLKTTFDQVAYKPAADIGLVNKEALYCAIGRCCQRLKEEIPFEKWMQQVLITEVQSPQTDLLVYVLQRRIAWLLGKWMSESCCSPNIPTIWQILVHLLSQRGNGSMVIRLTAAVALREGVDTLDFSSDAFAPFLPQAVTQLMDLIGTANTFDSKRKVDDALNVVIDRVGSQIIPLVPLIAGPIPALWIEADDDFLFKSSLLVTMTNLVKAIGPESTALSQIVVPLVQQSMEQGSELDQDGITLWKEALRNTNAIDTPNHSLANLLPLLIKQLDNNFDLLGSLLNITESYFLLEPARMLQIDAITLLGVFLTIVKSQTVLQSNKKDALSALNLLVQMTPPVLWAEAMHQSGLFPYLLDIYIIDKYEDTQLLCELEYLFSRIALADCGILLELVRLATPGLEAGREPDKIHVPLTGEKVLDLFLDRWWGTFDYMSHPRYRKLVAMGTAALVATAQPQILSRLHSEFFNLWMDVFCEIKEAQNPVTTDDDGQEVPSYLTLYWEQQDAPASYYQDSEGTPEYNRRKAVFDSDPVRATQLSIYVGIQLREAERIYLSTSPQTSFQQQYLALADPTVLQQITAAMNG